MPKTGTFYGTQLILDTSRGRVEKTEITKIDVPLVDGEDNISGADVRIELDKINPGLAGIWTLKLLDKNNAVVAEGTKRMGASSFGFVVDLDFTSVGAAGANPSHDPTNGIFKYKVDQATFSTGKILCEASGHMPPTSSNPAHGLRFEAYTELGEGIREKDIAAANAGGNGFIQIVLPFSVVE